MSVRGCAGSARLTVFEPMDQASIAQYSPDHTPRFFCANMPLLTPISAARPVSRRCFSASLARSSRHGTTSSCDRNCRYAFGLSIVDSKRRRDSVVLFEVATVPLVDQSSATTSCILGAICETRGSVTRTTVPWYRRYRRIHWTYFIRVFN